MSATIPGRRERIRARWHGLLRRVVRQALAERQGLLDPARAESARLSEETAALSVAVARCQRALDAAGEDLRLGARPFEARMTVDQAWRRHPGAPAVFARFHLPACDGCAVRFDETLEEAALAYGLDLPALLGALSALLDGSPPSLG